MSVSFPPEKQKKLSLKELESYLWKSLDICSPAIRISECKEFVLGILSLKYLSDTFEEAQEKFRHSLDLKGKSTKEINFFIEDPNNYSNIFFIPKNSRWNEIRNSLNVISNIGLTLNKLTQFDLRPKKFPSNSMAQTLIARIDCSIYNLEDKYIISCNKSFEEYFIERLKDIANL